MPVFRAIARIVRLMGLLENSARKRLPATVPGRIHFPWVVDRNDAATGQRRAGRPGRIAGAPYPAAFGAGVTPYNPLDKLNLGKSVAQALLEQKVRANIS